MLFFKLMLFFSRRPFVRSPSLLGLLTVTAAMSGAQAWAAFDTPSAWNLSSDHRVEESPGTRYDAPWNVLYSRLTDEHERRLLKDSDGRLPVEFQALPAAMEAQVAFWLKIYTKHSSQEAILFDEEHPEVVYEVMDFRQLARTSRNRIAYEISSRNALKARVHDYRRAFEELSRAGGRKKLGRLAQHIVSVRRGLPHSHSARDSLRALRVQWGQRDQVMVGLLSSSAFIERMSSIFDSMGVPSSLVLLSLVESSFNWNAVSHAGAAGVWQFMPRTGREFLHIDETRKLDERLSPIKSTVAAARLLNRNFRLLGSWPMAIGAYNHGHSKWARLKNRDRTNFAAVLSQCSRSRVPFKLGFASRNYYAEFLALLRAYHYQDVAFGGAPAQALSPVRYVRIPRTTAVDRLAIAFGVSEMELRRLNPDVKSGASAIPSGYWISVPAIEDDFSGLVAPFQKTAKRSTPGNERLAGRETSLTRKG